MKKLILLCLFLLVTGIVGCGVRTERKTADSQIKIEEAFQQVAYSYYMRGKNIQYNSVKVSCFPPEEATDQNVNYMNCSGLTQNVYKELLGITIPRLTKDLLSYSKKNLGNPEVIASDVKRAITL